MGKDRTLYFAYGTLVKEEVMRRFCPDAEFVCEGFLRGWRKSGLNIEPDERCTTKGILWNITDENRKALDGYEHYPDWYVTIPVTVETEKGNVLAFAYRYTE